MPWIFLLLPWFELWTLIELGAVTSGLTALAWVFVSLVLGVGLIRRQGEGMMRRIQEQQAAGGFFSPQWMMDDLALAGSGLLLMIPGLITDSLAVVFAIAPLRRIVARALGIRPIESGQYSANYSSETFSSSGSIDDSEKSTPPQPRSTLEGEFRRLDD